MTRFRFRSLAAIAALAAFVLVPGFTDNPSRAQSTPGPYALSDLGTLGGLSAQAQGINEAGQIVGYATNSANRGRAFFYDGGVMTDLGTLGGATAIAWAINESGQVAGAAAISQSLSHGFLWDSGTLTDLESSSTNNSSAEGINDHGEVIGIRNYWQGFRWRNGVVTDLGHLGGFASLPRDINNAGQAVGASYTTQQSSLGPLAHAALWEGTQPVDLGVLPGDEDSWANAINEHGVIVGATGRTDPDTYNSFYRPFIHDAGGMRAIPTPSPEAYALDINVHGVVVGLMATGGIVGYSAWIYADGVLTNLNSLIPPGSGLHLASATGINNKGQIVGYAYDSQYRQHAFLLTPVGQGTPVLSISDTSVSEGNSGTRTATLTVALSAAASQAVTVNFGTSDGTAAGSDYSAASGTLTFDAGQTSKSVSVTINGDRNPEQHETVIVRLSNVSSGAIIGDGVATATILDDEPRISIGSVVKQEGNSGTTPYNFVVTLSAAYDAPVSVNFATANQSATAPGDFTARTGTLTFSAGQTQQTITVSVKGDRQREYQEVFYVNLSGAVNGLVASSQGTGVIQNDDR
jgi:probable HAF family extracellular repeat protein